MPSNDVAVAYLHRNQVGHNFMQSLLGAYMHDVGSGASRLNSYMAMRANSSGPTDARNEVATEFLASDDEWLWWLDDDMGFPADALHKLLKAADPTERPIVGALCFAWKELALDGMGGYHCAVRPTIYDWVEHPDGHKRFTGKVDYPSNELIQVAGTGSACIVIHRSVFEGIAAQYEEDPRRGQPYDRIRGSDGLPLGEDISFCVRAAGLGHPIYVHTGVQTNHLKELWVSEATYQQEKILSVALEQMGVEQDAPDQPTDMPGTVELDLPKPNRAARRANKK